MIRSVITHNYQVSNTGKEGVLRFFCSFQLDVAEGDVISLLQRFKSLQEERIYTYNLFHEYVSLNADSFARRIEKLPSAEFGGIKREHS